MRLVPKTSRPGSRKSALSLSLAVLFVACSGGTGSPPAGDTGAISQKDTGSTAAVDDDAPDKPASLSGSYLAESIVCAVPKVPDDAKYVSACCNLRDKDKKKIVGKFTDDTFKIMPPPDTGTIADKSTLETVNTSKITGSGCHVVYRAPLGAPKAAAGLSLTGSGSAAGGETAKLIVKRLLYSTPLYKRSKSPAKAVTKGVTGTKVAKPKQAGATAATGAKGASAGTGKAGLSLLSTAIAMPMWKSLAAPGAPVPDLTKFGKLPPNSLQVKTAAEVKGYGGNGLLRDADPEVPTAETLQVADEKELKLDFYDVDRRPEPDPESFPEIQPQASDTGYDESISTNPPGPGVPDSSQGDFIYDSSGGEYSDTSAASDWTSTDAVYDSSTMPDSSMSDTPTEAPADSSFTDSSASESTDTSAAEE